MPILDTRPKDARRRMTPTKSDEEESEQANEAGPSRSPVRSPKRRRVDTTQYHQPPPSVHAWLHPNAPPPLMTESPPLHSSSSTFLAFSLAFLPPIHITSESTLAKEARRIVRDLDVPTLVGHKLLDCGEGAFQDGNGRVGSRKGKERIREPDHRMWAVRTLCLKERKDGTGGEDDYQVRESAVRMRRAGTAKSTLTRVGSCSRHSMTTGKNLEGNAYCVHSRMDTGSMS